MYGRLGYGATICHSISMDAVTLPLMNTVEPEWLDLDTERWFCVLLLIN